MLTEDTISAFYEDVGRLGLKRPVAAITKATGYSKGNVSMYLSKKAPPSENFIAKFYEVFKESFKNVPHPAFVKQAGAKELNNNKTTGHADTPGYVPASDLIQVLKEQNEFLRRNFETSLVSIVEGQQQTGVQLKALSWFSALAAAGGDEKKAQESILAINNKIAFYEGEDDEADISEKVDKGRTGAKRQQRE